MVIKALISIKESSAFGSYFLIKVLYFSIIAYLSTNDENMVLSVACVDKTYIIEHITLIMGISFWLLHELGIFIGFNFSFDVKS